MIRLYECTYSYIHLVSIRRSDMEILNDITIGWSSIKPMPIAHRCNVEGQIGIKFGRCYDIFYDSNGEIRYTLCTQVGLSMPKINSLLLDSNETGPVREASEWIQAYSHSRPLVARLRKNADSSDNMIGKSWEVNWRGERLRSILFEEWIKKTHRDSTLNSPPVQGTFGCGWIVYCQEWVEFDSLISRMKSKV